MRAWYLYILKAEQVINTFFFTFLTFLARIGDSTNMMKKETASMVCFWFRTVADILVILSMPVIQAKLSKLAKTFIQNDVRIFK